MNGQGSGGGGKGALFFIKSEVVWCQGRGGVCSEQNKMSGEIGLEIKFLLVKK